MEQQMASTLSEICGLLAAQRLPRWQELPDLDLYMDQVLSLIRRYLADYPGFDDRGLTASMVNNYVKMGVMPPPVKKKYTRGHLAHLIIICILKASLPIASIQQLIAHELSGHTEEVFYDRFCELFEKSSRATAAAYPASDAEDPESAPVSALCRAALRAQAEQALALKLSASIFDTGSL